MDAKGLEAGTSTAVHRYAGITPSFPQIDQRVCDPGGSTAEDSSRETKLPAF